MNSNSFVGFLFGFRAGQAIPNWSLMFNSYISTVQCCADAPIYTSRYYQRAPYKAFVKACFVTLYVKSFILWAFRLLEQCVALVLETSPYSTPYFMLSLPSKYAHCSPAVVMRRISHPPVFHLEYHKSVLLLCKRLALLMLLPIVLF